MEISCPSCKSIIDDISGICPNCGAMLHVRKKTNLAVILVPIVVIIFILASIVVLNPFKEEEREGGPQDEEPPGIVIDGNFNDWNDIKMLSDENDNDPFNQNADILEYGVYGNQTDTSFYLKVDGSLLTGESSGDNGYLIDFVYIFIDTDQNPSSGYYVNGIGADYMIVINGGDTEVLGDTLHGYNQGGGGINQWESLGTVSAAITGPELEVKWPSNVQYPSESEVADVLFYLKSWDFYEDFSDTIISNEEGILVVTQQGCCSDVFSGDENRVLKLSLEARNTDINITQLSARKLGTIGDGDIRTIRLENDSQSKIADSILRSGTVTFQPSIYLPEGNYITLFIIANIKSDAIPTNTLGFRITNNHDIVTDRGTVHISRLSPKEGYNDQGYIRNIPLDVRIDGAFADWQGEEFVDDIIYDVNSENLDIAKYGVSVSDDAVSFYLKVNGKIGWGTPVPVRNESANPLSTDGDDIIYIFIDSDNASSTGYSIGGIGADKLIEIKCRYNQTSSSILYNHIGSSPSNWTWGSQGMVMAGIDSTSLETQLSKTIFGLFFAGHFKVYFQTMNWNGQEKDFSNENITR